MATLGDLTGLLEQWYPPHTADSWDAVGLVLGDPADEVRRVLLAVDPVAAVVDEAVLTDADLLVTHHPLFLSGVHGVAATTPKGRVAHRLLGNGCALYTAHTNADSPVGGVSESMALALGLVGVLPLEPDPRPALDVLVVFVPRADAPAVREALADAGAGRLGDYEAASFSGVGEGRFRPLDGARPAVGEVGRAEVVDEERVEVVLPRGSRERVVAAALAAHPYEEPAYHVLEAAALGDPGRGSGRIGRLAEPTDLRTFADTVARAVGPTARGLLVAGDPDQEVATVALCGGAGDFLLDRARQVGADVYVTSDLRHHPASELREHVAAGAGAPALVDVPHWAAESTWLPVLRERLVGALGDTVEVLVSEVCTDPWTFRV